MKHEGLGDEGEGFDTMEVGDILLDAVWSLSCSSRSPGSSTGPISWVVSNRSIPTKHFKAKTNLNGASTTCISPILIKKRT